MLGALLLWGCFSGLFTRSVGQLQTRELTPLTTCTAESYFDITRNNCTACTALGQVPDTSHLDVYGNAISCACDVGYLAETNRCSGVGIFAA